METEKQKIMSEITTVLENDATFTHSFVNQRAEEIVQHLNDRSDRKIDLSPSRYGVIREEEGKTLLSVFEKGHNFYQDLVVKEIDITRLYP